MSVTRDARLVDAGIPAGVRLVPLPDIGDRTPIDVAESFRDLPGLAVLDSARPGRNGRWSYVSADPVDIVESPSDGPDPFEAARISLKRMAAGRVGRAGPPFLGGLVGYLSYDLGRRFE